MSESTTVNLECPCCGDSWYFDPEWGYHRPSLDDEDRNKMRLFAAAPDLLAACEAWARIMDAMGHLRYAELLQNGLPVDAGDLAVYLTRTAIQKARGEE